MDWHSIPTPHDNNPRLVSGNVLFKAFKSDPNLGLLSHDRPRCFHVKRTSRGRRDHPSQPIRGGGTLPGPPRSDITLPPAGPSRDAAGAIGHIEPLDTHSLDNEGVRDVEHPVESPSGVRSNGLPIYPIRDQRSGSDNKAKQATRPEKVAPVRKRTGGRKPDIETIRVSLAFALID